MGDTSKDDFTKPSLGSGETKIDNHKGDQHNATDKSVQLNQSHIHGDVYIAGLHEDKEESEGKSITRQNVVPSWLLTEIYSRQDSSKASCLAPRRSLQ
jgi:hypothetical protein